MLPINALSLSCFTRDAFRFLVHNRVNNSYRLFVSYSLVGAWLLENNIQEMKVCVDFEKVGSHTDKGLIRFGKACRRSLSACAFVLEIIVFLVLVYAFLPTLFFFLLYNSPVIVCTAVLLGALLSYGQENLPEACEKNGIGKDENSDMETQLLGKECYASGKGEEVDIEGRSVDGGEIIQPYLQGSDEEEEDEYGDEEKEKRIIPVFHVQGQEAMKSAPNDETEVEVVFTPRDISRKEEIQLGRGHFDRGIHVNKAVESLKSGESREDSTSKSKLICRSNSRRTVRFAMNDTEKPKDEKRNEEKPLNENRKKYEECTFQEGTGDVPVESPWTRIDRLSMISQDDRSSHSSSDHAENSSPDASLADITPMLEELDPLLDAETTQPASVEASEGNTEESENNDSGDEDDIVDADENSGTKSEKKVAKVHAGHREMKRIPWTDDDTKNVMDLGSSELERNQRLENLIAKRRARRNHKTEVKDLIDLQSDEKISLMDDDSSFSALLDSVSLHTSSFLFRSATLPAQRNPFVLPCDGEEETQQLTAPSSARVPSTISMRRNPFDFPYDLVDMDKQLLGETSGHEGYQTIHQKGLCTNPNVYNMVTVNAVPDAHGVSQVNSSGIVTCTQPQKKERYNNGYNPVAPFNGHVANALDHQMQQSSVYPTQVLDKGIIPSSLVEKINGVSNISSLGQTGLVSSIEAHMDHEFIQVEGSKYGLVCVQACDSDESIGSELSTTETESQSSQEVVHDTEPVASDVTEEHMQAMVSSPENNARSGSKETSEGSSCSASSDTEEPKSEANENDKPLCSDSEVRHPKSVMLHIPTKEADESQAGEPVFDSSPCAIDKIHPGLSLISDVDAFMEKTDSQHPSTAPNAPMGTSKPGSPGPGFDKIIIHESRHENAMDESKAVDSECLVSDAVALPVRDCQTLQVGINLSQKEEEIPDVKEVLDMNVNQPVIGQNVQLSIQVEESSSLVLENTAKRYCHVADSSVPCSPSSRTNHLDLEDYYSNVDEDILDDTNGQHKKSAVDRSSVHNHTVPEVGESHESRNLHGAYVERVDFVSAGRTSLDASAGSVSS